MLGEHPHVTDRLDGRTSSPAAIPRDLYGTDAVFSAQWIAEIWSRDDEEKPCLRRRARAIGECGLQARQRNDKRTYGCHVRAKRRAPLVTERGSESCLQLTPAPPWAPFSAETGTEHLETRAR